MDSCGQAERLSFSDLTIVNCSPPALHDSLEDVRTRWALSEFYMEACSVERPGVFETEKESFHHFDFQELYDAFPDWDPPFFDTFECRDRRKAEDWVGALLAWAPFWTTMEALPAV